MIYNNQILPPLSIYLNLIAKKDRAFFAIYIKWIELIARKSLSKNSIKSYEMLYKSVFKEHSPNTLLGKLQKEFVARNLSLSLLTEPIDGFSMFFKNKYDLELTKLSPIILSIISPIARMISVLNNNTPLFYQPFTVLMFAYLMLYIKHSPTLQKHFKNNKIKINTNLIDEQISKSFNEAKYSITVLKNILFKLKIGYFLGLLKVLIKKDNKNIKKRDYVNAFLYGLYYTLTIKGKKIKLKQI